MATASARFPKYRLEDVTFESIGRHEVMCKAGVLRKVTSPVVEPPPPPPVPVSQLPYGPRARLRRMYVFDRPKSVPVFGSIRLLPDEPHALSVWGDGRDSPAAARPAPARSGRTRSPA